MTRLTATAHPISSQSISSLETSNNWVLWYFFSSAWLRNCNNSSYLKDILNHKSTLFVTCPNPMPSSLASSGKAVAPMCILPFITQIEAHCDWKSDFYQRSPQEKWPVRRSLRRPLLPFPLSLYLFPCSFHTTWVSSYHSSGILVPSKISPSTTSLFLGLLPLSRFLVALWISFRK